MSNAILTYDFYARPARTVARDLLGKRLVCLHEGQRVSGTIVETEAYCDSEQPDLACHGSRNKGRPTKRTAIMFGPAGHAYVYFNYGIHWLFNVVTGEVGQANAVLIRALEPFEGEGWMQARRGKQPRPQWTNGPAKLTSALGIDKRFDGVDLCTQAAGVWLEESPAPNAIATGPRVGLGKTPEPWFSMPWRYWVQGNEFVSAYK